MFYSWNQDAIVLSSDWKQKKSWMGIDEALKSLLKEVPQDTFPKISPIDSNILVFRTHYIAMLKANELGLEFFYWLQNFFLNIIRVEIKETSWKIYFSQKLILIQDFKIIKNSSEEVIFCCDYRLGWIFKHEIVFHINITQARSRNFALFTFKGTRSFSFMERFIINYILKRFIKFLSL